MNLTRFQPCAALAPYIREYLVIESAAGTQNLVLPTTAPVLALRYQGAVRTASGTQEALLPAAVLTGLQRSARRLNYAPQTGTVLVVFRELGAATFFSLPLHELFGASQALEALWPAAAVQIIGEQLAAAATHPQRIARLEQLLLTQRRESRPDALVQRAVQRIQAAHGNTSIRAVLAELPLSRDPLEKRFRQLLGTSPKQFAAIVRLRSLLARQRQQPTQSLTETALAAGYFDQAHFNKDFRAFTNQTPQAFLRTARYW